MDLWRLDASQALEQIRDEKISVEEYAQSLLHRIQDRDEQVKAWVYLKQESILKQARELDKVPHEKRGRLHGLPVGIKDVILTKDMPTQYNSRLYETQNPITMDASPVATLRQSGALMFGKLTTTEFATSKQGGWHQNKTSNAHSREHTPGGSSSGSAAAVADFQIPIAIGTQTGGSIMRPASFNGCYGWKPTWNVISREGLAHWSINFDTCGFFSRSVADFELMADVFRLGRDSPRKPANIKGARIGLCKTSNWHMAGPGTHKAMELARSLLGEEGADVEDLELPNDFSNALDWHAIILASEGKSAFLGHYLTDASKLHEDVCGYVEEKRSLSRKDILDAHDRLATLRPAWDSIAQQYDAILTPSVPDEAPLGIEHTGDMSFCSMWTALHVPALNIPCCHGDSGLPVGLTLVGARLTDRHLLRTGKEIGRLFEQRIANSA